MATFWILLMAAVPGTWALQCGPHQYVQGERCCSRCPEGAHMTRPCTLAADTVCACAAGHWLDSAAGGGVCRPCDPCQVGSGASRPCSPHHNTVCRACPPGTFSHEVKEGFRECQRCSPCRSDQVMLQNCTQMMDTVCMDESFRLLSNGASRDAGEGGGNGSGAPLSPLPSPNSHPTSGIASDIPIYCGILGTVIFVLLLYVAVRQWKLRSAPQKSCTPVTSPAATLADPTAAPQIEPLFSVPLRKRLSEMPATERREIETQLCNHPTNNWSALAVTLGYTKSQIWELQDTAARKQTNPAHVLLADWSRRDATVTSFVQALNAIGRRDLATLVAPKPARLAPAADNFV